MAKKILIIEDEPDLLKVTAVRLETSGYDTLVAETAEAALELLSKSKPDLILLDLLLPKMQGAELCKRLKAEPDTSHIPIIIFTASVILVQQRAKEMCADDYMIKPADSVELLFKIKKFIG